MKLEKIYFSYIRSFRTLKLDFGKTSVLIGQNDHGKSSILKVLDIIFNQITEEMISVGFLSSDIAKKLLSIFSTNAKARRITLVYSHDNQEKEIHLSIRLDFSFLLHEEIKRGAITTDNAKKILKILRAENRFILIPAIRDTSSLSFRELFKDTLEKHGLSQLIPRQPGGTTRGYRKLKKITNDIKSVIKPYVDETFLPTLKNNIGFIPEFPFAITFDADIQTISDWIINNTTLAFQMDGLNQALLPLEEAGTGIQSAVLLALRQLENQASKNPEVNYYFAIEEPESFLHPQKQRELYKNILNAERSNKNLKSIITTHSPYIVSDTDFTRLGLVRKNGKFSSLHIPKVINLNDIEIFNALSNEVNNLIFFADKVIFVEGEGDKLVLEVILRKAFSQEYHKISIITAGGNRSFSPYLKMMKSWDTLKIPHMVVTDFDSLTKNGERAVIVGVKDAGYVLNDHLIYPMVDAILEKDEGSFRKCALQIQEMFHSAGIDVFIFSSDLEYALLTESNQKAATDIMNKESKTGNNYGTGYSLMELRRKLGSKGIPLNPINDLSLKKPYIHKKIAETIDLSNCSPDITRLIDAIRKLK